jgi:ribonuclease Z
MELLLLGTGTPLPSPNRCGGGQLITSGEHRVLVDCGWGVARRLMAANVPLGDIDTVCFTHMHSDHVTDLPDFLIMRWTAGGATLPLTIYGPEGTREMVEGFRAGLEPDVRFRIAHHGEKLAPQAMRCDVREVPASDEPTCVATIGEMRISAFAVDHRPVVPAFGYRIDCGGRALVLSGDTMKCDTLVDASRGADVLVCEAMSLPMMRARIDFLRGAGNERGAKILDEACDYHAATADVAAMARDAGVRKLVLTHLLPPIPDEGPLPEQFVEGMSGIYAGEIVLGRDLMRLAV